MPEGADIAILGKDNNQVDLPQSVQVTMLAALRALARPQHPPQSPARACNSCLSTVCVPAASMVASGRNCLSTTRFPTGVAVTPAARKAAATEFGASVAIHALNVFKARRLMEQGNSYFVRWAPISNPSGKGLNSPSST